MARSHSPCAASVKTHTVMRFCLAAALGATAFVGRATPALAYPWMIRHGYADCASCHTDPSGAGALTAYGRTQSALLTRSDDAASRLPSDPAVGEAALTPDDFLWGALRLPDALRLGGDVREAFSSSRDGDRPTDRQVLLMRSDLFGDLVLGRFRAAASIGYAATGSRRAALTGSEGDNLVSREHWLGFEIGKNHSWLLRAGRIAVPFGIRGIEHTLWVRESTRTGIVEDQQHGVALFGTSGSVRGEIMAILGNYQLQPDDYRERGYSAYVEAAPTPRFAIGASSLFTRARRDIDFRVTDYRQAHGLFVRYAPAFPLVLSAEADSVFHSLTWNGHRGGYAAMLQADWEAKQGVHLILTGETKNGGNAGEPASYGVWGSAHWFFAPHADLRLDGIYRRLGRASGDIDAVTWLVQLHVYL